MPGLPAGKLKKVFAVLFIVLAVFLACIGFLPLLADHILLPRLMPSGLAEEYDISVYRLGLRGCTFNVNGRPGGNPLIATANVHIDWSLAELREGRIKRLTINGLSLNIPASASVDDQGISEPVAKQGDNEPLPGNRESGLPPIMIDTINVVNSTVSVQLQQGDAVFPFSLSGQRVADKSQTENGILQYRLDVSLASQAITADLQYMHGRREIAATAEAVTDLDFLAGKLRNFLPIPPILNGQANVNLAVSARLSPFSLDRMEGEIKFRDMLLDGDKWMAKSGLENPAVVTFSGTPDKITIEAGDFTLVKPLKTSIHLDADFFQQGKGVNWQAKLRTEPIAGQQLGNGYILAEAPVLEFLLQGEHRENTLHLQVRSAGVQKNKRESSFLVQNNEGKLQVDRINIEADVHSVPEKGDTFLQGSFAVRGEEIAVDNTAGILRLPSIRCDGTGILDTRDIRGASSVTAELQMNDASLRMDEKELHLQGIGIELPLSWPVKEEKQKPGIFQIAAIVLRDVDLGKLKADLVPQPEKIELNGSMTSGLIPAGKIELHGSLYTLEPRPAIAELDFSIAETTVAPENFNGLFPALGEISGGGRLRLNGQGALYPHRISGTLSFELDESNLEIPAIQASMEGIHLAADFPDLPSLSTAPGQNFSIRSLKSKKIELTDIQSSFRLESAQSLFLEKISANWSGGRIITSSFRLQKEKPDIEVALICDRLNLADVLTQLGLARAAGQGAVSGRIPLLYDRGSIYVDHGFLFSTPGEKGTLKIIESDQLTEGIPKDVPHFSPLLFAGEALKNFQYDWAKLLITSEEENLLLQLQIDGKPAEVLPYRFDPQQNVFRKLAKGESGGIDQPIKLDVNFNVPLNELMRYNKEIQSILQNTRE